MKLINSLLDYENIPAQDIAVFTANRVVKRNGALVMGAGNAKACAYEYYDADKQFGKHLKNQCFLVLSCEGGKVGALVTKEHFQDKSDVHLVVKAINELRQFAEENPYTTLHVPYPAIGYGGLTIQDIAPHLKDLPDNVVIYK